MLELVVLSREDLDILLRSLEEASDRPVPGGMLQLGGAEHRQVSAGWSQDTGDAMAPFLLLVALLLLEN